MAQSAVPFAAKVHLAGLIAMFVGVQALFIAGSYYFPHWGFFASELSRKAQLHITIWVVVAVNILLLGGGYLLSLKKQPVEPVA